MDDLATIYEISKEVDKESLGGVIAGLVVLIFGIGGLILYKLTNNRWPKKPHKSIFAIILGTLFCTVFMFLFIGGNIERKRFLSILDSGQYEVAEGFVHVLYKQPVHGHDKGDLIEVGKKQFVINYFVHTQAYDKTIAHGGVLKDGVYARVYYYKGDILRIDLKKDDVGYK